VSNRCGNPDCDRSFGLVRFSWRFVQFCSASCRESYKRQRERNRAYWRWLYNCPQAEVADQK